MTFGGLVVVTIIIIVYWVDLTTYTVSQKTTLMLHTITVTYMKGF